MKKLYISFMVFGTLMFGIDLANVSTLVKSAIAGSCQCQEGCPCSHCSGKGRDCSCKK